MKRVRRVLIRLVISLAVVGVALEASFRWVLFGGGDWPGVVAARWPELREPESYAHKLSPEHWTLLYRLRDKSFAGREARHDPELGWVGNRVDASTFRHKDEPRLEGLRPVILVGDSFAACYGSADGGCFEVLLAKSALGGEYGLLNYGAGGYGFGQIAGSCRRAVARLRDRSPLVIVSALVESDLDRSLLGFRGWPKPQFTLAADGSPTTLGRALPPTREEYLEQYGVGIRSYAWRFLKYGTSVWPRAWREAEDARRFEQCCAVNEAILEELVADLREADVEFFFLLFHGRTWLAPPSPFQPMEDFFTGALEALDVPYVLSYRPLREDAARSGRGADEYWIARGPGQGHLTPLGNEVVFRCFLDGLAGKFDGGAR